MPGGAVEKIWYKYLAGFLTRQYIDAHFQLDSVYRSPSGAATVRYTIRYEGEVARTRTAGPGGQGATISGISQISDRGEIQSYFGPLKEYQLRISREKAIATMRSSGCTIGTEGITLFIGDYWEAAGKYSPDHIPEGFYWIGGRHPGEQTGTECVVDAESGKFRLKKAGPH
jgi:hypothetical protein